VTIVYTKEFCICNQGCEFIQVLINEKKEIIVEYLSGNYTYQELG
jgi:hypothetical protein